MHGAPLAPPAPAPASPPTDLGALAGAPLHDSTGRRVGEVMEVVAGADGAPEALSIEVRGPFGLGARTVTVSLDEFARAGDAVVIAMERAELRAMAAHAE